MSRKYLQEETDLNQSNVPTKAEPQRSLGLYRTLIAIAAAAATVIIVLWVGYTSGRYNETVDGAHKAIVIVVDGLHPEMLDYTLKSNKAPFIAELVKNGGVYGTMNLPATVQDQLAAQQAILTGLLPTQTKVYSSNDFNKFITNNVSSFLKIGREADLRTTVIAPTTAFSGTDFVDGRCNKLGLIDAECLGLACPSNMTSDVYCNAAWKIKTAEDNDENTRNEDYIFTKIEAATSAKMDLIYLELANFAATATVALPSEMNYMNPNAQSSTSSTRDLSTSNLAAVSEMYVTDALIGRIASLLVSRSASKRENWLLILTSDGNNAYRKAPYFIANLVDGAPAPMTQPANDDATTSLLDIFPTVVQWLGLGVSTPSLYNGTIVGVCATNGKSLVEGC